MGDDQVFEACCGAGGMAEGFSQYFDIVHACDIKPEVVQTYSANHPETDVRRQDIRNLTGCRGDYSGMTGVIGGPPCQGSSIINTRRRSKWAGQIALTGIPLTTDPRNELMYHFMRLVDEIRPGFFVMENVPGVPSAIKGEVIRRGELFGYTVSSVYLNAAHYGAAQTRKRWIVVGTRGRKWTIPEQRKPRTVRQAFAAIREPWGLMQSRPDTLERLARSVPGEWTGITGNFRSMIRLQWDQPAPAVVNLKKIYMVHPDECRNISLSEAAALQGFPPSYVWKGNESQIAQMIANAMPAELAGAIAGSIA
jgi:DNA (cytosine-5)-methyltransferase 1